MKNNNITCESCSLDSFYWIQFVKNFSKTTFCLEPARDSCKSCFTSAFLMKQQVETMLSLPLAYLGTASAGGILRVNNSLIEKFYKKLSGTNPTSSPPDLVIIDKYCSLFKIEKFAFLQVEILTIDTFRVELNNWILLNERKLLCWGSVFTRKLNLSNKAECNMGTFQSIFYVMKESLDQPHATNFDWNYKNFTGLIGSNTLGFENLGNTILMIIFLRLLFEYLTQICMKIMRNQIIFGKNFAYFFIIFRQQ